MGLFPAGGWPACSPLRRFGAMPAEISELESSTEHGEAEPSRQHQARTGPFADRIGVAHARDRGRRHHRPRRRHSRRHGGLLHRRRRADPRRQGPRHRHRHGQVRPRRAQDCGDAGLHRHAGLFRPSGRGKPWRSRHDHARRCHHGPVVVGGNRRAQGPDRLFAALPDRPRRHHRGRHQHARQGRRCGAGAAAGPRSLPAQPGADHLLAHATGAR